MIPSAVEKLIGAIAKIYIQRCRFIQSEASGALILPHALAPSEITAGQPKPEVRKILVIRNSPGELSHLTLYYVRISDHEGNVNLNNETFTRIAESLLIEQFPEMENVTITPVPTARIYIPIGFREYKYWGSNISSDLVIHPHSTFREAIRGILYDFTDLVADEAERIVDRDFTNYRKANLEAVSNFLG